MKVGRRADEEQQPRWSEQRVLSFEFKLFIFKNSSTLFITLLTHSLTHLHQHTSTSVHQLISTSAHQHISSSLPTILSSFLKSIVGISYIIGEEVILSPLVPTCPHYPTITLTHSLSVARPEPTVATLLNYFFSPVTTCPHIEEAQVVPVFPLPINLEPFKNLLNFVNKFSKMSVE